MVDIVKTVVLAVYFAITLSIGIYAWTRSETTPEDFYLGNREFGRVFLAMTLLASISSAWTFFGVGAAASGTGLGVLVFVGFMLTFYGLGLAIFGVRVNVIGRANNYVTPIEYLRDRYQSEVPGILYLIVCCLFLTTYVSAQIIGGGIALDLIMDIPYQIAIFIIAAFMAVYIHISGMRGVVWSDVMQGIVMVTAMLATVAVALFIVGPNELATGVMEETPEAFTTIAGQMGAWTPFYTLGITAIFVLGVAAYPHVYQRYLATDEAQKLKDAALIYPAVSLPMTIGGVILGVWSVGILTDPPNPDYVIPLMMEQFAHPIIAAIALSAGVAALMSSADSVILSLGSLIGRDVYRHYFNPNATNEQEVHITQVVLLVVLTAALGVSYFRFAGIFTLVDIGLSGFATTVPALFLSMYWPESTNAGAIASILVGVPLVAGLFLGIIPNSITLGGHPGFIALIVSLIVFVFVSSVTESPEKDLVYKSIQTTRKADD